MKPSHDVLKASNFFAVPEKPSEFFVLLMRVGLLVFFLASISLALYSAFVSKSPLRFALPNRPRTAPLSPDQNDTGAPTNISHVLFGIGASLNTWRDRSRYSQQWWDPGSTRGYAWLDGEPDKKGTGPLPYRVSSDWTRFRFSSSQSAVRIARIVSESFKLGSHNVRWFVMGDDDTVFFADNLISVLASYDHTGMYYIGGNSESVEQDVMHTYDMAFGGGGFAISYPLAARLVNLLDGCLDRYYTFYGSDQKIWACLSEIGVPLTLHRGFHQAPVRQCCEIMDHGSVKNGTMRIRIRKCRPWESITVS
ncbi:hypothetical protein L484_025361 [Morus notabilis]|uniref:Uncharacterized protein n=1 Tax=Morus notabilis TaxID=981085 RepID=W9R2D2_9ROSA|nr:hypothetical protein L484_025361 [Morus notabilis]